MTNATLTVKHVHQHAIEIVSNGNEILLMQGDDVILISPEQAKSIGESISSIGLKMIAAKHIAACKDGL